MGDHRVTIGVEFHMHGHSAKQAWWINWSPDGWTEVDPRVSQWIVDQVSIAMDRWNDDQYEWEKFEEAHRENKERDELRRLKGKYG